MKRVKIMLLSLLVLAVVGGALAFKAKKFIFEYCTTTARVNAQGQSYCITNPNTCPLLEDVKSTNNPQLIFSCTTLTNGNPANPCAGITCPNLSKITIDF